MSTTSKLRAAKKISEGGGDPRPLFVGREVLPKNRTLACEFFIEIPLTKDDNPPVLAVKVAKLSLPDFRKFMHSLMWAVRNDKQRQRIMHQEVGE